MQSATIKEIIVDDEPLARKRIAQLPEKESNVEIVADCADGLAAICAISKRQPDLLFLGGQMPELSGFDVLRQINAEQEDAPAVVFVTAYDQYTIEAFDASAVDYLLKPFAEDRFRQAIIRARQRIKSKTGNRSDEPLTRLLDYLKLDKNFLDRLTVHHKDRLIIVPIKDVDWIETYGNYLKIHAGGKTYLLRETMSNLAGRIDPEKFIRIHRSTLVNLDRVKGNASEVRRAVRGRYGRRHRACLESQLPQICFGNIPDLA